MKVKMYIELSESMWDYNLDCLEGREYKNLYASTKPSNVKMEGYDLLSFEVDIPDRYFKPRAADVILADAIANKSIIDD